MNDPALVLGTLDGLSPEQVNARFRKIMAAEEWDLMPGLGEDAFSAMVSRMYQAPRLFTFIDLFCGAGGSSIGLAMAGGQLLAAYNHSRRCIETHSYNFRDAEHECADLNHYDMRALPGRADVLWASPICTEISPAGGKKRRKHNPAQMELLKYGPVTQDVFERTRATFHDVIRACEIWRFPYVIVENVTEAVTDWELFGWWLDGMVLLGYQWQLVCVSSAHIGGDDNPHAAQRRDRIYLVFNHKGYAKPDVEPRPLCHCATCGDVAGVQWWKRQEGTLTASGRHFKVGKYGKYGQYLYRCPNTACRHAIVTPYERPAAAIIDWTNIGVRIGDRPADDPLAPATLRRIELGMRKYARPALVNSAHDDDRVYPADSVPFPSATTKIGVGLATPQPWLDANGGSWNTGDASIWRPFRTRTATEWEGLVVPPGAFITKNVTGSPDSRNHPVTDPLGTVTTGRNQSLVVPPGAFIETKRKHVQPTSVRSPLTVVSAGGNHHGLVVPYVSNGKAYPATAAPFPTMRTHDSCGLALPDDGAELDVMQAHYRMIQWFEQARAQRFPKSYNITGNLGERTAQAGNAVTASVACWLGQACAEALNRTAANA